VDFVAAPKPRAPLVTLVALTSVGLALGCYSTTPHRVQVANATQTEPRECTRAITDVFSRAGFVQLPTPPHMSMFFAVRVSGPYTSFMRMGGGVGVTIAPTASVAGTCQVTLEALSPDVGCSDAFQPASCLDSSGQATMNSVTGQVFPGPGGHDIVGGLGPCPSVPSMCMLSSAPGSDNDAAVDELARRLQAALGPRGVVN
jgi:hypothetical protein